MISGTEPQRQATTGVPQAMASIMTGPKGRPVDREQKGRALPRNRGLLGIADLAHELDQRIAEQGSIVSAK